MIVYRCDGGCESEYQKPDIHFQTFEVKSEEGTDTIYLCLNCLSQFIYDNWEKRGEK